MVRASIDIGSNSILLLICDLSNGLKVLENEANVTGLGRDLDLNKKFIDVAMDESYEVLSQYKKLIEKHKIKPTDVIMTATEASRVAENASEFYEKIKSELGLEVKIINGKGESYYSAMGVLLDSNITEDVITIMDIGGASTELTRVNVKQKAIIHSFSMPVGVVRLNNWRLAGQLQEKLQKVFDDFADDLNLVKTEKLFCVAGTMTSVGNMYLENKEFIEHEVNGLDLPVEVLDEMIFKFKDYSPEDYLNHFPFLGKRSQTIKSGLLLADSVTKLLDVEKLYISTYGLRFGTLLKGKIEDEFSR